MSAVATTQAAKPVATGQVEAIYVPKELWIAALLATVFSYLLFSENGALLTENWEVMHEFFHDGRHVFGVPCH